MEYVGIAIMLLAFEFVYLQIARRLKIVDLPHHQSSHKGWVIRGGGIIFYAAFLLWSISHGFKWGGGLLGLTILAGVSFLDDVRGVSPTIRLICQFVAVLVMINYSGLLNNLYHVILILAIACVGAVNIYNFMDGINGMIGGYSLVVSLALLYVNKYMVHFAPESLLVYVTMSVVVFCFFNFRRRAKCFAGDVGSLSMGFIMVYFVLVVALRGHSMSWMAMLIVYLVDGGMTLFHRVLLRENLMKPHKKHAYQIMANELKMPHLVVSGIYMGLQAVCCVWYFAYPGYLTLFLETGILVTMYLVFMKRYYYLHEKR
ncbi:MAG: glycosyltransferase family 4 protein [Prevotella sp.]|nr:glycosyltransferase family 4 protein [Prevotella sp.]